MRHRWLRLVGGLGIAVAVTIGTLFFGIRETVFHSTLPFEERDWVVALEVWDVEANQAERRILHDYSLWQQALGSVEDLGAWRTVRGVCWCPRRLAMVRGRALQ